MTPSDPHTHPIFRWIEHGKYPVLFGVLCLCGLGLPLPEDIPLITAGVLISKGQFNLAMAAISAWCGIMGGDCMLYMLGRHFGPDIVRVPIIGTHINAKRMARVDLWFSRWGVWVVAVCRMFAGVRGAMVVVAGTTRFNFFKFFIADGLAAIVSGGLFMVLGYKFGQNSEALHHAVRNIKGGMLIAGAALVVVIVGSYLLRRRQCRARELAAASENVSPASEAASKAS